MKQKTLWTVILILAALISGPVGVHAADTGGLPYTFSSGTPAKASEVNANFNYVNNGNIVVIDGTGAELGTYLQNNSYSIEYMNANGYILWVGIEQYTFSNGASILGMDLYYTTSDCTGDAYINMGGSHYWILIGSVLSNNGSLYYLPKNAGLPGNISANSGRSATISPTCNSGSQLATLVYKVLPNDPSVTGESSITKTPPLRIIRRTP